MTDSNSDAIFEKSPLTAPPFPPIEFVIAFNGESSFTADSFGCVLAPAFSCSLDICFDGELKVWRVEEKHRI